MGSRPSRRRVLLEKSHEIGRDIGERAPIRSLLVCFLSDAAWDIVVVETVEAEAWVIGKDEAWVIGKDEGESASTMYGGAAASLWSATSHVEGVVPEVVGLEARKSRSASVASLSREKGDESAATTCGVAAILLWLGASISNTREELPLASGGEGLIVARVARIKRRQH